MADLTKIEKEIRAKELAGYFPCAYFELQKGELSWDKPETPYIEVFCPPEVSPVKYWDFKMGDIIKSKDGFKCGQLILLWPSINMYKTNFGFENRGHEPTGTLDFLNDHYTVMLTCEEVVSFFKGPHYGHWVSVKNDLPKMLAKDIGVGTEYRVRHMDGTRTYSKVSDHESWKHDAALLKITHWWDVRNIKKK